MPVSEIQRPSQDYDGHVDLKKFWDAVAVEMLSRGFIPYGKKNPFVVPLSYNNWAPWIGPQTRQSDLILNTEFEKIPTTTMSDDSEYLEVTEERLSDEIINLKVEELDVNGGISLAPPSQVGMATPLSEHHRDGQEQQELVNDAKDQGNLNWINTIMASKGCWGQELQEVKKNNWHRFWTRPKVQKHI
ncbi:hypothetical protein CesoFtcFv8_020640 [Champsocephalus esox]|uniref:Uncharacterized protein n=1 Tax=Champsocephalus esox TaxID=159716 RepID=A0AAN8BB71_9TELE|nr:hypothetical protein CesoFtcFv8_020640 [Champsocephalus esox]